MFVYSGHALSYTTLKQLKQIIQIKHNIVKNPNWPEADQLAIYKCGQGFELGRSVKQIQLVARAGLEPGTAGLRVRRADHSATLPLQHPQSFHCMVLEEEKFALMLIATTVKTFAHFGHYLLVLTVSVHRTAWYCCFDAVLAFLVQTAQDKTPCRDLL